MVLDLRNNPGGYLRSPFLCGMVFGQGRGGCSGKVQPGDVRPFRANGNEALKNFRWSFDKRRFGFRVGNLAGNLRDVRGVKLVGEKSSGKGVVQELRNDPAALLENIGSRMAYAQRAAD